MDYMQQLRLKRRKLERQIAFPDTEVIEAAAIAAADEPDATRFDSAGTHGQPRIVESF
jgi:hypothetical protein